MGTAVPAAKGFRQTDAWVVIPVSSRFQCIIYQICRCMGSVLAELRKKSRKKPVRDAESLGHLVSHFIFL